MTDLELSDLKARLATSPRSIGPQVARALIERLEAGEACLEQAKETGLICCEDVCCKGTAYSRWRKLCGRDG